MGNRRRTPTERAQRNSRNRCRACRRKVEMLHKGEVAVCPDCGAAQ